MIDDVRVHYKCKRPSDGLGAIGIHLFHGFLANLFSWECVQSSLAEKCDACVTASDITAFGLTERPRATAEYSRLRNGAYGRGVLEHELQKGNSDGDRSVGIVLAGHSLGGLLTITETVRNPENVAGVVLVAPAIKIRDFRSPQIAPLGWISRVAVIVAHFWVVSVVPVFMSCVVWCLQPIFFLTIRFAFQRKGFWQNSLSLAYSEKSKVSEVLDWYRLPSMLRHWEWGILRFVRSSFFERSRRRTAADIWKNQPGLSLLEQFAKVVLERGIPVLVIHGEHDRVVPVLNSEQLCKEIPSLKFLCYPECAHHPHEEFPMRFVEDVASFIKEL